MYSGRSQVLRYEYGGPSHVFGREYDGRLRSRTRMLDTRS